MKIAIDISQLAYPGTGVAVYTEQLVRHLLRIDKDNRYLLFGCSLRAMRKLNLVLLDVTRDRHHVQKKIYPFPPTMLQLLWNRLHILSIEQLTGRIDVFHSSDWVEPPAKASKVTTVHDLLVYKYPQYMHPTIVANQRQKFKWVKKESKLIIVDSENTKKDVMDILDVEEKRLRVIHLGVDKQFLSQPHTVVSRLRARYGIRKDYILTFGSQPRKNTKRIVAAYKQLKQKDKIQLVIVGRFIVGEKPALEKNIIYTDLVDYHDLPALYSGASCFVYPSLYEGFGLPVLESMACGCPVVTSNKGSLKEVAGKAAIIVDPENEEAIAEGIRQAIECSDSDYIKRIQEGFSWVKRFTWDKTARQTLAVYKELL